MFIYGVLYSQIDEDSAELYLMWILQLSRKNQTVSHRCSHDNLAIQDKRIVVLELEAQLIHQIVGIYSNIGKPSGQLQTYRNIFEEYQSIRDLYSKKNQEYDSLCSGKDDDNHSTAKKKAQPRYKRPSSIHNAISALNLAKITSQRSTSMT